MQSFAHCCRLKFPREERNMERASPDARPSETIVAEDTFHNVLFYFVASLSILVMEPEAQCEAQGNYNVAFELQQEAL